MIHLLQYIKLERLYMTPKVGELTIEAYGLKESLTTE